MHTCSLHQAKQTLIRMLFLCFWFSWLHLQWNISLLWTVCPLSICHITRRMLQVVQDRKLSSESGVSPLLPVGPILNFPQEKYCTFVISSRYHAVPKSVIYYSMKDAPAASLLSTACCTALSGTVSAHK